MAGKYTNAERVVVKVGSGFFIDDDAGHYRFRGDQVSALAEEISDMSNGKKVVLVTSGAIATAVSKYGLPLSDRVAKEQQLASLGQPALMAEYISSFSQYGKMCSQLLVTRDDIEKQDRREFLMGTLQGCLDDGWIPIVNENDTIATDEITFGDNDILGAMLAPYVHAQLFVMLSNPIKDIGRGGRDSKEAARQILAEHNIPMEIINGRYEKEGDIWKPKIRLLF